MTRRLGAALACRVQGARLYGKPLQNLAPGLTILDNILNGAAAAPAIDVAMLGIAAGDENKPFERIAAAHGAGFIIGDEKDVLARLIQCGEAGRMTDIFRITSECPFPAWEFLDEAWSRHVTGGYDITICDYVPDGAMFEIYRLDALRKSHREGSDADRSEYCSQYARNHTDAFRIGIVKPPPADRRTDLRLTVDYPEDLVVCRQVFEACGDRAPLIPLAGIFAFLDTRPDLVELVAPFHRPGPYWATLPGVDDN